MIIMRLQFILPLFVSQLLNSRRRSVLLRGRGERGFPKFFGKIDFDILVGPLY